MKNIEADKKKVKERSEERAKEKAEETASEREKEELENSKTQKENKLNKEKEPKEVAESQKIKSEEETEKKKELKQKIEQKIKAFENDKEYKVPKDERLYNKNFIEAWENAFKGIAYGFRTQRNLRIQLCVGITMFAIGIVLKINAIEWAILVFAIFLVVATEMMNTAVETVVDLCTTKYNKKAGTAKDVAAGAVVLTAINAVIVAIFLFGERILEILK